RRALGGAAAEVFAFAEGEGAGSEGPLLLAGRFERGGLFQASLLPNQHEPRWRVAVVGSYGRAELTFPLGWPGPARLSWRDEAGGGGGENRGGGEPRPPPGEGVRGAPGGPGAPPAPPPPQAAAAAAPAPPPPP